MTNWVFLLPPSGGARQVAENLLNAFRKIYSTESLHVFDCKKYLSAFDILLKKPDETITVDLLNQSLVVQCLQYDCTHLFIPALCPVTLFTLNLLQKLHIITIHWFVEDYRRASYWQEVIHGYTWFLAVQKGLLQDYCTQNGIKFAYVPTAASPAYIMGEQVTSAPAIKADISFIGIPTSYRVAVLEYLSSQGISLALAGDGWQAYTGPLSPYIVTDRWIDSQQAASIQKQTPVSINLSFKEPGDDRTDIQISPRVYDILAGGTILLSENVPLLHETIGECHYYTFTNMEEALQKVKTILSISTSDDIRNKIRQNREIIIRNHTWEKRAEQIIDLCV